MARSDLLINLVRSRTRSDDQLFHKTVEAIIVEERNKQHHTLADQLAAEMKLPNLKMKTVLAGSSSVQSLVIEATPHRQLADLILRKEVLNQCEELIEEHKRIELLRSYNMEPRNRVLLLGPPGNGKTSLAEALAESLAISFITVRYDGLIGSFLGETNQRLKNIFDYVRTQRCILFFDEFDTIGKERGDVHETGEIKRVVSSLLLQIDALPPHVLVVAASNHGELLDRAVWRRFQIKLNLPNPSELQIQDWLKSFESRVETSFKTDLSKISKKLIGLNFSDIENFGLNVFRRHILEQPGADIRSIVQRQLAAVDAAKEVVKSRNASPK